MTVVTPSKWLAELAEKSFLGKFPVKVINNGIDTEVFKPTYGDFRTAHRLENKKIILGVASIWGKRKGLDDFIKLAGLIDDNYVIVLVGVTEKQKNTLPCNIIGISRTNNTAELAEIYTAANVFFNPTYEDNYPTVNLEAQACGTPVITYKTGGSPESTDPCGVLPQGDVNGAIKLIEKSDAFKILLPLEKKAQYGKYIKLYEELTDK